MLAHRLYKKWAGGQIWPVIQIHRTFIPNVKEEIKEESQG